MQSPLQFCRGAALLLIALLTLQASVGQPASFRGQVVNLSGIPVEGARLFLNLAPADASVEYESESDTFGFFALTNVSAGNYKLTIEHRQHVPFETNMTFAAGISTNKLIRLVPIDAQVFFDIHFQAWCLATHASLSGAQVTVEYWVPDNDLSGAPDLKQVLTTVANGTATALGMKDGFYRFQISRPGWQTLNYTPPAGGGFVVVGDKVRLVRTHFGTGYLQPNKTTLDVTVTGFDPVKNKPNQPLKGMIVKLSGLDLTDDTVTLVPPVAVLSREDGTFRFEGLAPIRWKVQVGRLGYKPKEVIVTANAAGLLPATTIEMELEPTKVKVIASSMYQTNAAVKDATIRLEGVLNSNSEGISRELKTVAGTNATATALFENLLPGRYWVQTKHTATISGLPSRSGPLFGPSAFTVSFFPKETFGEVTVGVTEDVPLVLEPIPAKVRGRNFVTSEIGELENVFFDPEPNRIFALKAQDGVTFLEHKLIKLLPSGTNSFSVDTDAAGQYTILIPPGIFGVQIPTMAGYTGHNIEFANLTAGQSSGAGAVAVRGYLAVPAV